MYYNLNYKSSGADVKNLKHSRKHLFVSMELIQTREHGDCRNQPKNICIHLP